MGNSTVKTVFQFFFKNILRSPVLMAEHSTFGFNKKGHDCNRNTKNSQKYRLGQKSSG
jgi:hypothetical protein